MKIKLIIFIIFFSKFNNAFFSDCLRKFFCYCCFKKQIRGFFLKKDSDFGLNNDEDIDIKFNNVDESVITKNGSIHNIDIDIYNSKLRSILDGYGYDKENDNKSNLLNNNSYVQFQKNNSSATIVQNQKENISTSNNRKSSDKSSNKQFVSSHTNNGNSDNRTISQDSFNIFKPRPSNALINNSSNIMNFQIKVGLKEKNKDNANNLLDKTIDLKEELNKNYIDNLANSKKRNKSLNVKRVTFHNNKKDENLSSKN